jgi:uncharacterized membrane protein
VTKGRLEAFSDGVIAILITIMILELKVPHGASWDALRPLVPVFSAYVLSYIYLGIYWNNHHHMLHTVTKVNGKILWANLHLLFWLSLFPVTTAWIGETRLAPVPTALYGTVFLAAAIAYLILQTTIIRSQGPNSRLAAAVGGDRKGKMSSTLYAISIPVAFYEPRISFAIFVVVALIWLVPDKRIEARFHEE